MKPLLVFKQLFKSFFFPFFPNHYCEHHCKSVKGNKRKKLNFKGGKISHQGGGGGMGREVEMIILNFV